MLTQKSAPGPQAMLLAATLAFAGAALADGDKRYNLPASYKDECGSCHVAYPPQLLSRDSWRGVMAGLARHFGSDASVDAVKAREISAYLEANAGTKSKLAAAGNLQVSRTPWFRQEHRDGEDGLSKAVWTSPAVKSAANCGACHQGAERGDYSERDIRVPK